MDGGKSWGFRFLHLLEGSVLLPAFAMKGGRSRSEPVKKRGTGDVAQLVEIYHQPLSDIALQAQGPELNPQYHKQKNKRKRAHCGGMNPDLESDENGVRTPVLPLLRASGDLGWLAEANYFLICKMGHHTN